jgi:hypothetical protein
VQRAAARAVRGSRAWTPDPGFSAMHTRLSELLDRHQRPALAVAGLVDGAIRPAAHHVDDLILLHEAFSLYAPNCGLGTPAQSSHAGGDTSIALYPV